MPRGCPGLWEEPEDRQCWPSTSLSLWKQPGDGCRSPHAHHSGKDQGLSHIAIPWPFHLVNLACYSSIGVFFVILVMLIPLPVLSVVFGSLHFFLIILEHFGPFWAILVNWAIFVQFLPFVSILIHFHTFLTIFDLYSAIDTF